MKNIKVKFCIVCNDMDGSYVNDVGELEVSEFSGYELFCKLYKRVEGEGSVCGVSEEEFYSINEEMVMGDWLVVRNNDGSEVMSFVRV